MKEHDFITLTLKEYNEAAKRLASALIEAGALKDDTPTMNRINVGDYYISPMSGGGHWIAHKNGKLMSVTDQELEELIDNYFVANFKRET